MFLSLSKHFVNAERTQCGGVLPAPHGIKPVAKYDKQTEKCFFPSQRKNKKSVSVKTHEKTHLLCLNQSIDKYIKQHTYIKQRTNTHRHRHTDTQTHTRTRDPITNNTWRRQAQHTTGGVARRVLNSNKNQRHQWWPSRHATRSDV